MSRALIWILAACVLSGCRAQTYIELSPSLLIPNPVPSAPLTAWTETAGRSTLSTDHNGATLRGFRYAGTNTRLPIVFFLNGNGMTIAASDALYRHIATMGPTVVVFDYRGYGFSTASADLGAFRTDALRVYDDLVATAPDHRVVVYGFSIGTAMASYIASQRELTGLILAAPIASAEEEFPIYEARMGYPASSIADARPSVEARDIFGEVMLISKSQSPLLVLHGTSDSLVPIDQGREVFATSPASQKRMVELEGAGHNQTASQPQSFEAVQSFLAGLH